MDAEQGAKLLDAMKKRKIAYCMENNLPIPEFQAVDDYLLEPQRQKAKWEIRWQCSNCGALYNFDFEIYLPPECKSCGAIMD